MVMMREAPLPAPPRRTFVVRIVVRDQGGILESPEDLRVLRAFDSTATSRLLNCDHGPRRRDVGAR